MKNIIQQLFTFKKKSQKDIQFSKIKKNSGVLRLFESFYNNSNNTEIRFVGGCIRKILKNEIIDDIDLAVNANPDEVKNILKKNKINFFETGLDHGTITAVVNSKKFEITSLRKDIITDGRHAKIEYTMNWLEDANRRDFTINSIYSDLDGNLYDPHNGKLDLNKGIVRFIGDPEKRIKEDYLRILRYLRFFSIYSKFPHSPEVKKVIIQNIPGIKNLSNQRMLDELKKIFLSKRIIKLVKDSFSLKIFKLIFPELENITILKKLNSYSINLINELDFVSFLSLILIDDSDNAEYFMYKNNLSNLDKKRIKFLKENNQNLSNKSFFNEKNLSKLHYKYGDPFIKDILNFKILKSRKVTANIISLKEKFNLKQRPVFPIKAKHLIEKFKLKEGKDLGIKLRKLENIWLENNFNISNKEIIDNIRN